MKVVSHPCRVYRDWSLEPGDSQFPQWSTSLRGCTVGVGSRSKREQRSQCQMDPESCQHDTLLCDLLTSCWSHKNTNKFSSNGRRIALKSLPKNNLLNQPCRILTVSLDALLGNVWKKWIKTVFRSQQTLAKENMWCHQCTDSTWKIFGYNRTYFPKICQAVTHQFD